jgi:exosortase/archaeosortase family protein
VFRYTLLYIILGPVLFGLIYFEDFSPLFFLNDLQTDLTTLLVTYGVAFFDLPITMQGPLMFFDNGAKLIIHYTCNAMTPILLYTAAIVSYPTWIKNKIIWLIGGYVALVALNLVRMLLVSYAVTIDPDYFHWAHNYIGRYGMGVLTLTIFYIFTQHVSVLSRPDSSDR